jgi:hypothetical protein
VGTVTFTFKGSRAELAARLRGLPKALAGRGSASRRAAEEALAAGAGEAEAVLREAFLARARGGADGSGLRWPALRPETLARKGARGLPRLALVATGALLASFHAAVRPLRSRPGLIAFGSADPKAAWHHKGTRTLPARRLWPEPGRWPAAWWRRVGRAMAAALAASLSRGGLTR